LTELVAVEGTRTAGQNGWSRVALYRNPNPIVKIQGKRVLVVGSGGEEHHKDDRDRACYVLAGSAKVKIGGIPVARVGDAVSDGDVLSADGAAQHVRFG
jgi:uncharacterized Zn-binding protein involved in type VI secretion